MAAPGAPTFLETGPVAGPPLLLAHGAGAPMDSPFMEALAGRLTSRGLRVLRFEFPYMRARRETGVRRPPDREAVLLDTWRTAVRAQGGGGGLFVGGKSMGGRMASMVADELGCRGLVCFGYPFHAPGRPEKPRIDHLRGLRTPALILQGTRDPFGLPGEVADYGLSPAVAVHWLAGGDHDLKTPRGATSSQADLIDEAASATAAFVARIMGPA
ncbi:MAG: alpha/beta hydrolase [Chloroflexi bacterium]|nr:alpha/beta hydrolase [Chloroflexota bacterium]